MEGCWRSIPCIPLSFLQEQVCSCKGFRFSVAAIVHRPSFQGLLLQQLLQLSGMQAGAVECSELFLLTVEDLRAHHARINQEQGQGGQKSSGTSLTCIHCQYQVLLAVPM